MTFDPSISGDAAGNAIVFVDSQVDNYQGLLKQDSPYELVLLDSNYGGIEQISEALSLRESIDSVHIISHASASTLTLGGNSIDYQYFDDYLAPITNWRDALSDEADILLYGCNVAASKGGKNFIESISAWSGADVAASDDITGADGDYTLEYATGSIDSGLLIDQSWNSNLETDDLRTPGGSLWSMLDWMSNPSEYNFDPAQYLASNPDLLLDFLVDPDKYAEDLTASRKVYKPWNYKPDGSEEGLLWDEREEFYYQWRGVSDPYIAHAIDHYFTIGYKYQLEGDGRFRPLDDFDEVQYLASHPDLISTIGYDPGEATSHYINYGFFEGRAIDSFDAMQYVASNPDLISSFSADLKGATIHYITNGHAEGRATDSFDAMQYVASHPDLISAIGTDVEKATMHYINSGHAEGRTTDSFDALQYLASNPFLMSAVGTDLEETTMHYINHGFREGRSTDSFDAMRYLASNPFLMSAVGTDPVQATMHYLNHGFREGRSIDSFDAAQYLALHPDLVAAFGNDLEQATMHYLTNGFREGRATGA